MYTLSRLLDYIKTRDKMPKAEKAALENYLSQLLIDEKIQTLSKYEKSLEDWAKEIFKMVKEHPEIDEKTATNYIMYVFSCIMNKEKK